jgi:WD40 repeat protein
MRDVGKIHSEIIWSMVMTRNNEFLFTSDDSGNLRQWAVKFNTTLVKDYPSVHDTVIRAMAVSADNEHLFTSDIEGFLKQFNIKEKRVSLFFFWKKIRSPKIMVRCTLAKLLRFS